MRRLFLIALAWVALAAPALAQPVLPTSIVGTECWNSGAGGPGGTLVPICTYMVRNSTGYQALLAATSGTISPSQNVNQVLIAVQPNGSTTINTPVPAFDGALFSICNVSNAALAGQTITLAASTGSSLAAGVVTTLTTLAARTCEEIQYVQSNTTWYQIR